MIRLIFFFVAITSCNNQSEQAITPTTPAGPPFDGTIFLDPDIIVDSDPSTFVSLSYVGQDMRLMYDRRVNKFITVPAFIYNSTYDDGLTIEIQVNPEFQNPELGQTVALKFATVIGRLPTSLRVDVETVWIHKGTEPFGSGNNNLLVHTGQATQYEKDGILEETFVHEASHSSLDAAHATSAGWISAQESDGNFISTYALDNPKREDIAESFLLYLAVRHRSDRISQSLKSVTLQTIPNRIKYFDTQKFEMYPIK